METSRVLVSHCGSILRLGIESLLSPESSLTVVSADPAGEGELYELVERFQPNILILGECALISQRSILTTLLLEYPNLWVFSISAASNWLHVYQKQDILITQATDLVHVIHTVTS